MCIWLYVCSFLYFLWSILECYIRSSIKLNIVHLLFLRRTLFHHYTYIVHIFSALILPYNILCIVYCYIVLGGIWLKLLNYLYPFYQTFFQTSISLGHKMFVLNTIFLWNASILCMFRLKRVKVNLLKLHYERKIENSFCFCHVSQLMSTIY